MTRIGIYSRKGIIVIVLVVLFLCIGNNPFSHTGPNSAKVASESQELQVQNFYITSNFTVETNQTLNLDNYSIELWSFETPVLNITILGNLSIIDSTMSIESVQGSILRSVEIFIMGRNASLNLAGSSLNVSGKLTDDGGKIMAADSSIGKGDGSPVHEVNDSLHMHLGNGSAIFTNTTIGGLTTLQNPGNFAQASIYATNALPYSPLAAPGKIRVRSANFTAIYPYISSVNISMEYNVTASETSGVYFDVYAGGSIIKNETIAYNASEGLRTYNFSVNVTQLKERASFFTDSSEFYFSTYFPYNRTLAIYNLSADLESNSWAQLYGKNNFFDTIENSTVFVINSTLPVNNNPGTMEDGATSYLKDYWHLYNSTLILGDSGESITSGDVSPFVCRNSSVTGYRMVKFEALDDGFPYPVSNVSVFPLNVNTTWSSSYLKETEYALSSSYLRTSHMGDILISWVPYFSISDSSVALFESFQFSINGGLQNGTMSLQPFPQLVNHVHMESMVVDQAVIKADLQNSRLVSGALSNVTILFTGNLDSGISGDISIGISGNEIGISNLTFHFTVKNHTELRESFLVSGLVPMNKYSISIRQFVINGTFLGVVNSSAMETTALLPASPAVSNVTVYRYPDGTIYSVVKVNSSAPVPVKGYLSIIIGNGTVTNIEETALPGITQFVISNVSYSENESVSFLTDFAAENHSSFHSIYLKNVTSPVSENVSFTENGLPDGQFWGIEINSTWHVTSGTGINLTLERGNYSVTALGESGFSASYAKKIDIGNTSQSQVINYSRVLFSATFYNNGTLGHPWFISIAGRTLTADSSCVTVMLPAGNYSYIVTDPHGFFLPHRNGTLGLHRNVTIAMISSRYVTLQTDLYHGIVSYGTYEIAAASIIGAYAAWRIRRGWRFR